MVYALSLSKLETVLAEAAGGRLNGEPLTPWLSCISNAALLILKLLLSASRNILTNGFVICFLMMIQTFHQ